MASSRKPPGSPPPQQDPDFGDFGDSEDTDKNLIPNAAKRKLRLPLPGEPDDPLPKQKQEKKHEPSPKLTAPFPPAAPPKPKRLKVFRVEPEGRGSNKIIFAVVGILLVVVTIAFAFAPDGKTPQEIAQERYLAQQQGASGEEHQTTIESVKGWFESATQDPPPQVGGSGEARPKFKNNPPPKRERHAKLEKHPQNVEEGYGLERAEQPHRNYDNFDASKEQGSGIPMLMVFSKPAGMMVEIDGQIWGVTPMIRTLPKDTKRVKVRLSGAGFREWEQTVSANEIEQFKVGVTMERIAE